MYTLYDVFSYSREKMLKSLGSEYVSLNTADLRMLLIINLRVFNLLDQDSVNVANSLEFVTLISQSSISRPLNYNSMYMLDLVLLIINNKSSLNLVSNYGSNYSKSLASFLNKIDLSSVILNNDIISLGKFYNITYSELSICDTLKVLRKQYLYKNSELQLSNYLIDYLLNINRQCVLKQLLKTIIKIGDISKINYVISINSINNVKLNMLKYVVKYYILSYGEQQTETYRNVFYHILDLAESILTLDYIKTIYDYINPKIVPTFNMLGNSESIIREHVAMLGDTISYMAFRIINDNMLNNSIHILFLLREAVSSNAPRPLIDTLYGHAPLIMDREKYETNLRRRRRSNETKFVSLFR